MDYPGKVITKNQVTPTQISATGVWTLDDAAAAVKNNNWPVALVPNPISKSLRFNSADSAYLNRTPATATNRRTYTWSGWVKRGSLSSTQALFESGNAASIYTLFWFTSSDQIQLLQDNGGGGVLTVTTNAVFRDPSAWYHVVITIDTTQATSNNRTIIYVNGTNQLLTYTAQLAQNADTWVNFTYQHRLGARTGGTSYYNGYMTEVNFIDGQALTPSDFGLTNPQTGQWIPLKYSGTYGTNGFYLNFKDATSTTTLGYDYSGNANNWTTNNFSVTAGAGNDSLTDVPTPWVAYNTTGDVGGVIRGNYCVMNVVAGLGNGTYSNGNLDYLNGVSATWKSGVGSLGVSSEKYYFEYTILSVSNTAYFYLGAAGSTYKNFASYVGQTSDSWGFQWNGASSVKTNNGVSTTVSTAGSISANDVIQVAIDLGTGSIWWGRNNTWVQGNPSAGTGASYTNLTGTILPAFAVYTNGGDKIAANFGQRPFAYTPPTGFRSLCTTNLPATAIGFGLTNQGDDYFNTVLYSGNNSTQNITVGFQPDFVWSKCRNVARSHRLSDAVRGSTRDLYSDTTAAEVNDGSITSFISTGFSLNNATGSAYNTTGENYVSWAWKAGGTGVSNTAGTITSTVSANTTAGFSISTYTGNGSSSQTVGHGLGVAPGMVIIKTRSNSDNWRVWHTSLTSGQTLTLNSTAAQAASGFWPSNPSTSVVYLGTDSSVNSSTWTYVMYSFAPVAGYSAFGSYTGNGSTDGPFVYLGFRPAFVMVKISSGSARGWSMWDDARDYANGDSLNARLEANSLAVEDTGSGGGPIDILSNGFKIRNTAIFDNESGSTFIYACFAESPFQFANAR